MNPLYTATPIWHFYHRDLGKNLGGERCRWKMNEQAGWGACVGRGFEGAARGVFLGDRIEGRGYEIGKGGLAQKESGSAIFVSI